MRQTRTDLDGEDADWIVEGNSPFALQPEADVKPRRAVLMVHGLADAPFAVRDLAVFFQQAGFFALGMQLPGHGTRPGDLLNVGWRDWQRAHQHLLGLLQTEFDEVYLLGFSAGAALSLYQSLLNPSIRGVFAFSPAIGVTALARLAFALRHLGRYWRRFAWFDVQPDTDCFKYESLPNQAIAETYAMVQSMHALGGLVERRTPLFVVASERDATLKSQATLDWFAAQVAPRRMLYYTTGRPVVPEFVTCIQARIPEQRIRSFAHTSLIHSPDNPHYGVRGVQRFCTHYYHFDIEKYRRCKAGGEDCLGEMFDESPDCEVIRRLTYNPRYDDMLQAMHTFLREVCAIA